jgi:hypothetical protein
VQRMLIDKEWLTSLSIQRSYLSSYIMKDPAFCFFIVSNASSYGPFFYFSPLCSPVKVE